MYFTVFKPTADRPKNARSAAFLEVDNWDDMFQYNTLYSLIIFDDEGNRHVIGGVKIGEFDMEEDQRRPNIPNTFNALDERFFSLGQDDSYYSDLGKLGHEVRDRVLKDLRDLAYYPDLFQRALHEKVTRISLLRSISPTTVEGQFRRLAKGGARLSCYEFKYVAQSNRGLPVSLDFIVEPESHPPTNIHVIIGRNGVGKTRLLYNMTRALVIEGAPSTEVGIFSGQNDDISENRVFAGLVSVTFSAFDPFDPLSVTEEKLVGVKYAYIGLKQQRDDNGHISPPPRTPEDLAVDFAASMLMCRQGVRISRWRRALETLEADPIFKDAEIADLASEELNEKKLRTEALRIFSKLSSGHKIVLLTITRLVETVEERTLVLLDEPEAHLHPPLLSAFVRSLSDLLIDRNGVALIATHSPVVLQEVPRDCVWKVSRFGAKVTVERPEIETFGENVGLLTREVFGLEVTHSGFHKLLNDAVHKGLSFDEIINLFGGKLGAEARAIVRSLLAEQALEED